MFHERLEPEDLERWRDAWVRYEASDVATHEVALRDIRNYADLLAEFATKYDIDDTQPFTLDPSTGAILYA